MAEQIREEFEKYIKELTTSISKEIFLEKLENLYKSSESVVERLKICLFEAANEGRENRDTFAKSVRDTIELKQGIEEKISETEKALSALNGDYKIIFKEFSELVHHMNEEERDRFGCSISETMEAGLRKMEEEYGLLIAQTKQILEFIIQPDLLNRYVIQFNESSQRIEAAMKEINSGYQEVFKQFSQKVQSLNKDERFMFLNQLQGGINDGRDAFITASASFKKELETFETNLCKLYNPKASDHYFTNICAKIDNMERKYNSTEYMCKEELYKFFDNIEKNYINELQEQKKQQTEFMRWQQSVEEALNESKKKTRITTSLYWVISNTVIIALLTVLVLSSQPLESDTITVSAAIVLYILVGIGMNCYTIFAGRRK